MDPRELMAKQNAHSDNFAKTFATLKLSETRTIEFEGFSYTLQLNPGRIKSSKANISIPVEKKECFLCRNNMPADQIKFQYNDRFFISINPFPILDNHLTIISREHTPQTIKGNVETMLQLSDYLENMVVFYNSPKSGASAPFHCHFQAGWEKELPCFVEIDEIKKRYTTESGNGIWKISEPTRRMVVVEDSNQQEAIRKTEHILAEISRIYGSSEPEANIGVVNKNGIYRAILFPREKHRPEEYFREGDNKILVSPGFADMAGLIPCSIPNNYKTITKEDIRSIMNQVSMPENKLNEIKLM